MSGGSLDYFYGRVDDVAEQIGKQATTPAHRAFAAHLMKVGKALHDIEWLWSGDYGPGDEVAAIMAVIAPADVLAEAVKSAEIAAEDLRQALSQASGEAA